MGESCQRNYCHLRRVIAAAPLHLGFIIILIFITTFNSVESTGSFEVRLHRFTTNFSHQGQDLSGCCGGSTAAAPPTKLNDTVTCTCPVSFRVCVKNYQASVDIAPPCVIGEYMTPVFDAQQLSKPLQDEQPIVFYFNFTWPGSFSFVIEAFHQSEKTGERMLLSRFIAQRTLGTKQDWTRDILVSNRTSELELYYRVRCEANYFGERCVTFCKSRDDKFGHYTCRADDGAILCRPGWTDSYCATAICRPGCHTINGYCTKPQECTCRHGWEGELCDKCSVYPGCEHGTCREPWQCDCDEGWGGLFCSQDLNYCTNHRPCKNSGTCTNTGAGSYTCNCTAEFMGKNCDLLRNPCQVNPCQNGGICLNPTEGNYTCECPLGFYGPNCETSASICTDNPCKNGGTCIDDPSGFTCACTAGFFGSHCEQLSGCVEDFCSYGGQCVMQTAGPHCSCRPGFAGKRCDEVASCDNAPCQNGGHCYTQANSSRCSCAAGFSGTFCEIDHCSSEPCQNGGKCFHLSSGFECLCEPGFAGKICAQVDSCHSAPCQNGGLCKAESEGPDFFSCHCPTRFEGSVCQFEVPVLSQGPTVKGKVRTERTHRPTVSNISHQIMTEDQPLDKGAIDTKWAITLSCSVIAIAAVTSCAIVLVLRFCCVSRRKPKHCEEAPDDELKQNERNTLRMNNKCAVPQKKIVNIFNRTPGKLAKEAPAKVLNAPISSTKRVLEKNLLYAQRTLDRKDDPSGSDNNSHRSSQDWLPCNNGGVFVIQDHAYPTSALKIKDCHPARPPSLLSVEDENIFATEV